VTEADLAEQLKALDSTLRNIEQVLDLPRMRKEKADLEEQASAPDLWNDQAKAQQVTSRLSYVGGELTRLEKLRLEQEEREKAARAGTTPPMPTTPPVPPKK
jgi:peptide chain release factor 2